MSGNIFLETIELSIAETSRFVQVPVRRTGDLSQPVTITYGLTGDSATQGQDFLGGFGTVTMLAGQDRVLVDVPIIDDAAAEATEIFTLSLVNVDSGKLLAPRTTRVAILDDENPVIPPVDPPLVSDYDVTEVPVIAAVNQPLRFVFAPHDPNLLYVAEKTGALSVFDITTGRQVSTFVDLQARTNSFGDRGLMDVAFHPDFANNPYVYVFYVVDPPEVANAAPGSNAAWDGGGNRFSYVSRFTADAATGYRTAVAGSEVILVGGAGRSLSDISGGGALDFTEPALVNIVSSERMADGDDWVIDGLKQDYLKKDARSHAGGAIEFGPDGMLYIATGDGTSFDIADPRTFDVQNLNSLSGKVLRVDPMTGQGVADNPFVTPGMDLDSNAAKVFQLGLRNPFSMSFDGDGRVVLTDTGWFSWESIHIGGAGANFAWPYFEGSQAGVGIPTPGYRDFAQAQAFYAAQAAGAERPSIAYGAFSHASADPGYQVQAITGGAVVYDGNRYPIAFRNDYFFSDFPQGEIYTIDVLDRREIKYLYTTPTGFGMTHFAQGPDGYVYYADMIRGQIGRLLITEKSAWVTTGDATVTAPGQYALTDAAVDAVGLVTSRARIDLRQDFTLEFQINLGALDGGADGIALVLHNDPAGTAASGWGGGGFGVGGIRNGFGIEFDGYDNGAAEDTGDIAADHTNFFKPMGGFHTPAVALPNLEDGAWHTVRVTWDAQTQTLSYSLDGITRGSLAGLDLSGEFLGGSDFAHIAFGGANGGTTTQQGLRIGTLDAVQEGTPPPPPPPPTGLAWTTYGSAAIEAGATAYTLTNTAGTQQGSVMSAARIDIRQDFTLGFDIQLGSNDAGGDGIAFVLHNDPAGAAASGWGGGGFGIGGIGPAFGIEFDTFDNGAAENTGDIAADHTNFFKPMGGWNSTAVALPDLEDGAWHAVRVTWDAQTQTMAYSIDGVQRGLLAGLDIAAEFLGGSPFVHLGFAAATGGAANLQQLRITEADVVLEGAAPAAPFTAHGDAQAAGAAGAFALTGGGVDQKGSVMSQTRIDLRADFTASFQLNFGASDAGADGIAFVLHNDPAGDAAQGWGGGGFGMGGISRAFGIEFDIFNNGVAENTGDIAADHTNFFKPMGGWNTPAAALPNLEDGAWHDVTVTWDADTGSLSYTLDGVQRGALAGLDLAGEFLDGSPFAYLGFGAANGGTATPLGLRITAVDALREGGGVFDWG